MAKKPAGLRIDVTSVAEGDMTQYGTVHVGQLIVSATGVRSLNHAHHLSADDLVLTDAGILGRGSSGSVRRVRHAGTGQLLALKEIKVTSQAHLLEIRHELEALHVGEAAEQSPYVVEFYGAYSHEGSVFIAMECLDGSLADLSAAGPIPPRVVARMARSVLEGLKYLHRTRHRMHRDLKPSNLLYARARGVVKISDFGVSSQLECTRANAQTFVGTVTYMSPERLKGELYDYAGDVWSLGVSIAELALGRHPYAHLTQAGQGTEARFWVLVQHLSSDAPSVELPAGTDPLLASFVDACLIKDHTQRPRAEQLLAHPFITTYADGDDAANREALAAYFALHAATAAAAATSNSSALAQSCASSPGGASGHAGGDAGSNAGCGVAEAAASLDDALRSLVDVKR